MSAILPQLLTITALSMTPGSHATIAGAMESAHDGARFDAASMFDLDAGGLRLERANDDVVTVVSTGGATPVCAAAGVSSPCLVPRLVEHAHARLLTVDELRATLRGGYEVSVITPATPAPRTSPLLFAIAIFGAAAAVLALFVARRNDTPLGRVLAAARAARRATSNEATLAAVRAEIERLVEHARAVERLRRECELALLAARRAGGERLAVEREEEAKLEGDLRRSQARLTEIAAALRLVPLRVREARDVKFGRPPLDVILSELNLRDRAIAEAEG